MNKTKTNSRAKIQSFGGFLTGMVIPNMGAFIAWGLLTALFIPTGWMPNEHLGKLVDPMVSYLLPLLLAYTGGNMVAGLRGAVIGTIATFGLIIGADIPMFLGAMVMGPVSALIIKAFDKAIDGKIPTGFEMVVNNFSLGIFGLVLCLLSYLAIGPIILQANKFVTFLIENLVKTGFLPILSLINEPAKVLFLNNVIDQGIYYPLGMQAAATAGKSIYFMVASNPGTGLGLLAAYSVLGKGTSKRTAPGAMIIHFLGGIHEIYFPYVLMNPIMIVPMILGGATGTFVFSLFKVGLVAGPSPGSIFSYLALTPKGNFVGVIAGVLAAAIVSFLVSSFLLKVSNKKTSDFEDVVQKSKDMKQEGKDLLNRSLGVDNANTSANGPIAFVAFACDAGLGSSAMGASAFKKRIGAADLPVRVANYAIENVPPEVDVIVVHRSLVDRAKRIWSDKEIVSIENFMGDPKIDELFARIEDENK